MLGAETIRVVFIVSYILVVFSTLTGLLKIAFKDNEVLMMLHKMSGPLVNLLFLVFFVFASASFGSLGLLRRLIIIAIFICLIYAGLVTGSRKDSPVLLIVHRVLGILSFALFTMLLVVYLML